MTPQRSPDCPNPDLGVAIDQDHLRSVQDRIIAWFAANRRDLPWRRTRDPWRILVSVIMLQQIQVVRAIPFYAAFLDRFPTVAALADAPLADAIRVWGDLGRYRRIPNLHRTARLIMSDHGGVVPSNPAILRTLPGVGPYTPGAVACFAFEQDVPLVDTNIRRVLHRLFIGVDVPRRSVTEGDIVRLAAAAVPRGRGWAWNQGVMEFGALHCTARRPACERCPLRSRCRSYPDITAALAAGPAAPKASPPRYEESNRFLRGRVLTSLREHSTGIDAERGIGLVELGESLPASTSKVDSDRLASVVESLRKDGLAVAEERSAYDSSGRLDNEEIEIRARLP